MELLLYLKSLIFHFSRDNISASITSYPTLSNTPIIFSVYSTYGCRETKRNKEQEESQGRATKEGAKTGCGAIYTVLYFQTDRQLRTDQDVTEAEPVGATETGPYSSDFEDDDFDEPALEDLNGLMDELETYGAEPEPATQTFSTLGDFLSISGNVPKLNK